MRHIKFHAESRDGFHQQQNSLKVEAENRFLKNALASRLAQKIQNHERDAAKHRLCGRKRQAASSIQAARRLEALLKGSQPK